MSTTPTPAALAHEAASLFIALGLLVDAPTTTNPARLEAAIERAYVRWQRRVSAEARANLLASIIARAAGYDRCTDATLDELRGARQAASAYRTASAGVVAYQHLGTLIFRREQAARKAAGPAVNATPVRYRLWAK